MEVQMTDDYKKPAFSSIINELNGIKIGTAKRQDLIKKIEKKTGRCLLTYS